MEDLINIINEKAWKIRIFEPSLSKPYRFTIRKLKLKENNIYRDNPVDQGNNDILTQFLDYLSINLGIIEDKDKNYKEIKDPKIIERNRRVQAMFNIIKDLLNRASSNSCGGKGEYVAWQIKWNIPTIRYISEKRQMLKNFGDDLKYLFLEKRDPLTIFAGRYKITEEEILTESSLRGSQNFEDHKQIILNDLKKFSKDNFNIDLK